MLTKEKMDKFLEWMKQNSNEECKDMLAYGVKAGVNNDGYLMQLATIYHGMEKGNHKLYHDDLFFNALKEFFKEEKLNYYIMTTGAFYSEAFVYDPANSGFFPLQLSSTDTVDDEFTFTSDVNLRQAANNMLWNTVYGNTDYLPEISSRFTEVAR